MAVNEIPDRVRAYVARSVPPTASESRAVELEQVGEMRLAPEKSWMPFTAEQSIAVRRTQFRWHARCKMAPFMTAVVEDAYEDHRGRLDAKVWGVVPVAHARGIDVDQGEAQRYLAELPWCPMALAENDELHFRELGPDVVRVWVANEATHVDLAFNRDGDIETASTTTRARGTSVQPWAGAFSGYRDFGGIRAPSKGRVWWESPDGRFEYWRATVTRLSVRT